MKVQLAGVTAEIECKYEKNRLFFEGYQTEKEAEIVVAPGEDDLLKAAAKLRASDEADGIAPRNYPEYFLENCAIHAILAEKLLPHNVLLMHGSALAFDGNAYIFTAPSGTGKSTHSRLWREAFGDRVTMVNDDKPMLRFESDLTEGSQDGSVRVNVCGTPWNGKHRLGGNFSAPLRAIAFLSRSSENSVTPVTAAEAFQRIMKQIYLPESAPSMRLVLEMAKKLVNSVKFYDLKCNMEPDAPIVSMNALTRDASTAIQG